jgi:hypothetical protein
MKADLLGGHTCLFLRWSKKRSRNYSGERHKFTGRTIEEWLKGNLVELLGICEGKWRRQGG